MKIQLFADVYDDVINELNQRKSQTQNELNNLAVEKQNALNTYEQNYQTQMNDYNDLMQQQEQNINTWANTQRDLQEQQKEYNLGLIEQGKQKAEKQTNTEIGNAYIDYQKAMNRYSGTEETLASQGLSGTGFADNQRIAMNITYQNRVSSAKTALQQANVDFNNQMQQALLNNQSALAELALSEMTQRYQLALQGFEYRTNMQNNRLNYIQDINDTYFSKGNTLQNRLDTYTSAIGNIKQAREESNQRKQELAQELAWEREKYYNSLNNLNEYDDYYDNQGTNGMAVNGALNAIKSATGNNSSGGVLTNLINSTKNYISNAANKKYSSSVSPRLSGATASKWYEANLYNKSLTKNELQSLLKNAYDKKQINANDVNNILWAFGLE